MEESKKDLFIIDTRSKLGPALNDVFGPKGYGVVMIPLDSLGSEIPIPTLEAAKGFTAIALFLNKKISVDQVKILQDNGNKLVLCCSASAYNVPLDALRAAGIRVAVVPSYSPESFAEYAISSMFALAKQIPMSYEQCRKADFTINRLSPVLLRDSVVGIIGTTSIGRKVVEMLSGLVHRILCFDEAPMKNWIAILPKAEYVTLDYLVQNSNIISIHTALLQNHYINTGTIGQMKEDVILINTSRGGIINTPDLVKGLEDGKIFGCALDVFEGDKNLIFQDLSKMGLDDFPEIKKLTQMPNVIISSHVAFYTDESIKQIAEKTLLNFVSFVGKADDLDKEAFIV